MVRSTGARTMLMDVLVIFALVDSSFRPVADGGIVEVADVSFIADEALWADRSGDDHHIRRIVTVFKLFHNGHDGVLFTFVAFPARNVERETLSIGEETHNDLGVSSPFFGEPHFS